MPSFKYVIELSDQDKAELLDIVKKGNSPARTILRANILLASDKRSDKYMTVSEIAAAYHTTPTTVQTVRTSYCEKGLKATINRKKRETPPVPAKVTGEVEAHIIAPADSRRTDIQNGRCDCWQIGLLSLDISIPYHTLQSRPFLKKRI